MIIEGELSFDFASESVQFIFRQPLRVVSRLLDRQNRLEERLRYLEKLIPWPEAEKIKAKLAMKKVIREALRDVIDPEVGTDIVDLGLI